MTLKQVLPGFYLFTETLDAIVNKNRRREVHSNHIYDLIAYLRRDSTPNEKHPELLANLMRSAKIAATDSEHVSPDHEKVIQAVLEELDGGALDQWAALFAGMLDQRETSDEATYAREAMLLRQQSLLELSPFRGRAMMLVAYSAKDPKISPCIYGEVAEVMRAMASHHHTRTVQVGENSFLVTAVITPAKEEHQS